MLTFLYITKIQHLVLLIVPQLHGIYQPFLTFLRQPAIL